MFALISFLGWISSVASSNEEAGLALALAAVAENYTNANDADSGKSRSDGEKEAASFRSGHCHDAASQEAPTDSAVSKEGPTEGEEEGSAPAWQAQGS